MLDPSSRKFAKIEQQQQQMISTNVSPKKTITSSSSSSSSSATAQVIHHKKATTISIQSLPNLQPILTFDDHIPSSSTSSATTTTTTSINGDLIVDPEITKSTIPNTACQTSPINLTNPTKSQDISNVSQECASMANSTNECLELKDVIMMNGHDDNATCPVNGDSSVFDNLPITTSSSNGRKPIFPKSVLIKQQSPSFLIIESLVWNICCCYEKDHGLRRQMFVALCQSLEKFNVLGVSYLEESLQPIRDKISVIFNLEISKLRALRVTDGGDPNSFIPDGPSLLSPPYLDQRFFSSKTVLRNLFELNRYDHEFEEIMEIARGGFGIVKKARHRFDNCIYAVKEISFPYKNFESFSQIIREVKLWANMEPHSNVVAYKTAWIQNRTYESVQSRRRSRSRTFSKDFDDLYNSPRAKVSPQVETRREANFLSFRSEDSIIRCHGDELSANENSDAIFGSTAASSNEISDSINNFISQNKQYLNDEEDMARSLNNVSFRSEKSDEFVTFEADSANPLSLKNNKNEVCNENSNVFYEDEEDDLMSSDSEESADYDEESSDSEIFVDEEEEQEINNNINDKKNCEVLIESDDSQCLQEIANGEPSLHDSNHLRLIQRRSTLDYDMNFGELAHRKMKTMKAVLYIQMELCGENLRTYLDRRNSEIFEHIKTEQGGEEQDFLDYIDQELEMSYFRQILKGVLYIHSQRLIHRDLKPQNIMFSLDGKRLKIGDFGLATLHHQQTGRNATSGNNSSTVYVDSTRLPLVPLNPEHLSKHTTGLGTSVYAAPEQQHCDQYDHRVDMYSLGIILFELLYPMVTEMEKVQNVSNLNLHKRLPEKFTERWPEFAKLVLQLTDSDAKSRPESIETFFETNKLLLNYSRPGSPTRSRSDSCESFKDNNNNNNNDNSSNDFENQSVDLLLNENYNLKAQLKDKDLLIKDKDLEIEKLQQRLHDMQIILKLANGSRESFTTTAPPPSKIN